jgi:hypothetical protein
LIHKESYNIYSKKTGDGNFVLLMMLSMDINWHPEEICKQKLEMLRKLYKQNPSYKPTHYEFYNVINKCLF